MELTALEWHHAPVNERWDIVTPLFSQVSHPVGKETFRIVRELSVPKDYEHIQTTGPYWTLMLCGNDPAWVWVNQDGKLRSLTGNLGSFLPPFTIVRWLIKSGQHRVSYVVSYRDLPQSLREIGPVAFLTATNELPVSLPQVERYLLSHASQGESLIPSTQSPPLVRKAKKFIETHYTENFRIRELARSLRSSHEGMTRAFQKVYGITPVQFRVRLRCFSALYQLQTSDLPVALCAADAGYNNIALFNRQFHSVFQASPSRFRCL